MTTRSSFKRVEGKERLQAIMVYVDGVLVPMWVNTDEEALVTRT